TVSADGATLGTYGFNSALVDGGIGLASFGGSASFDRMVIRTNDPAFKGLVPVTPSVSVGDALMLEGAVGSTPTAQVTVSLSEAAPTDTTIDWATANGSATAGADYTARSGKVTFLAGSTTATISIPLIGDGQWEANETFNVVLSNPVGLMIDDGTGVVTIQNDDAAPSVSVTTIDATGAEAATPNPITFTVARSANLVGDITVNLGWGGTAAPGTDYTVSASGGTLSADRLTLTLAANVTSATITVTPVDDTFIENAENVTLTLNAGSGYVVGTASASGTISDNDSVALPTLSIAPASVTEGNTGTRNVTVTVKLSAASGSAVTVAYATADGTAKAGSDYQTKSGTLTFAAGSTTQSFTVVVIADKLREGNETFTV
ncbi:MAG: Calx-beta domain-containing protein, partial [Actinomycetota bacterium]|nr:Calx-beta domain-containing protein [Actinomycetota bacterium]